ncbi:MAG: hypothetical protein HN989_17630 [Gammaproteobacteria bacterium]|nr:hypothetical protein [Gammaproteobacteria bacterium]
MFRSRRRGFTNHQVIPAEPLSLLETPTSFRPEWRSHGAEKSRVSRAGDLSVTSPSVTSVEKTGVNASVEKTGLMWIDASVEKTGVNASVEKTGLMFRLR